MKEDNIGEVEVSMGRRRHPIKGPSIYYVIQIWGPGGPLPPYCNILINLEDPPM